jgi:CelD/BcsL family acetyltransferase involved in cellulose biosynthesis
MAAARMDYEAPVVLASALLTADADLDALQPEWDRLVDASDQAVFFLRWHWNRTWWRMYAPPKSRLYLITCRDAQRRLVGLAPFYLREQTYFGVVPLRQITFLGTGTELKTSEYLDIITARGYERAAAEAIAGVLRARRDWDRLWLWCVPSKSSALRHLAAALGARARVTHLEEARVVDTSTSWDATRSGFSQNIDRVIRQVFRLPACRFSVVERADELEPALDDLVRLHQARWTNKGEPGSFVFPRFEEFLRVTARHSFAEGRLRLWRLHVQGVTVAALIGFHHAGTTHYLQSGIDPSPAYKAYSLGRSIIGLSIKASVDEPGTRAFDFMGGLAPYKKSWTPRVIETSELEMFSPTPRAVLFRAARRARAALAAARRAYRAKRRAIGAQA